MANRIRKGDTLLVIAGSSKGQVGEVIEISGDRAVLGNVNMQTKHIKSRQGEQGRIEHFPGSIHVSNLSHIDENGKASRIKFVLKTEGEKPVKTMILKSTGKEVRKV